MTILGIIIFFAVLTIIFVPIFDAWESGPSYRPPEYPRKPPPLPESKAEEWEKWR